MMKWIPFPILILALVIAASACQPAPAHAQGIFERPNDWFLSVIPPKQGRMDNGSLTMGIPTSYDPPAGTLYYVIVSDNEACRFTRFTSARRRGSGGSDPSYAYILLDGQAAQIQTPIADLHHDVSHTDVTNCQLTHGFSDSQTQLSGGYSTESLTFPPDPADWTVFPSLYDGSFSVADGIQTFTFPNITYGYAGVSTSGGSANSAWLVSIQSGVSGNLNANRAIVCDAENPNIGSNVFSWSSRFDDGDDVRDFTLTPCAPGIVGFDIRFGSSGGRLINRQVFALPATDTVAILPTSTPTTPDVGADISMTVSPRSVPADSHATVRVSAANVSPDGTYTLIVICRNADMEQLPACGAVGEIEIADGAGETTLSIFYQPGGLVGLQAIIQAEGGAAISSSTLTQVYFTPTRGIAEPPPDGTGTGTTTGPPAYGELPTPTPIPEGETFNPEAGSAILPDWPQWTRLSVEPEPIVSIQPAEAMARVSLAWSYVAGAHRYEILRDGELIPSDDEGYDHLGREYAWTTEADGSLVKLRIRGAVDGGESGRTVETSGFTFQVPPDETRYSPWSDSEFLHIDTAPLLVDPMPNPDAILAQSYMVEAERSGNVGHILAELIGGGNPTAWNITAWATLALVAAGSAGVAVGRASGDGLLSPGAMAAAMSIGFAIWSILAPILGQIPWPLALTPMLLIAYPMYKAIRQTGTV